jgi:hypothetical protein
MKDPVAGRFTIVDEYFPHPGRTPMQTMLTGYLEADGVSRIPAETLAKLGRDRYASKELPAIIDRADPSRFVIDWSRVPRFDGGAASARKAAEDAANGA